MFKNKNADKAANRKELNDILKGKNKIVVR